MGYARIEADDDDAHEVPAAEETVMAVYLLHFDRAYHHARHYIGYAADDKLHERIDAHYNATPGDNNHHRLMQVIRAAGISFTLAHVWHGADRHRERRLKRQGASRRCPICRAARNAQKES